MIRVIGVFWYDELRRRNFLGHAGEHSMQGYRQLTEDFFKRTQSAEEDEKVKN